LPAPRLTVPVFQFGYTVLSAICTLIRAEMVRANPVYSLVRVKSKCTLKGRVPEDGVQASSAETVAGTPLGSSQVQVTVTIQVTDNH